MGRGLGEGWSFLKEGPQGFESMGGANHLVKGRKTQDERIKN